MYIKYNVKIEKFSESHYIKKFSKKYKNFWEITLKGILLELERFNNFEKKDGFELISYCHNIFIYKVYFRIAGTKSSKKSSGNRYIISLDKNINEIKILLIYNKNDIKNKNETVVWKKIIRDNYDEYEFLN
jgi:hypothetical protein